MSHEAAHRWYASHAPEKFATCTITQGTLLRLHMRFARDNSAAAAWQALKEITSLSRHEFWDEGFSYDRVACGKITGSAQVTDAWLVALAQKRKGKLTTFDQSLALLYPGTVILVR